MKPDRQQRAYGLDYAEIRSLVYETAPLPQHRHLLESFLRHQPTYRHALRAIEQLKANCGYIWGRQ